MGDTGKLIPTPVPSPYLANISSVQDFMQCRYRWACKWVYNRVPRTEPRALSFGKLLHNVFEDHLLSGDPMDKVIDRQIVEWRTQAAVANRDVAEVTAALSAITDLESYREVLCQWKDQYPCDIPVLEVETPFEIDVGHDIKIKGKPDRVSVVFGRAFHIQNRSLAATTNFDLYTHLAKRHLHELVYGYAISRKFQQYPYGGTIFNLLRKITHRSKTGKILHPLSECLWQGMLNFSQEELESGVQRAKAWIQEMREEHENILVLKEMPLPNERLNGGPYGNSIDPYFLVLQKEISLDDDRYFKHREETYA